MRKTKLIELAKLANLRFEENKVGDVVFSTTIWGKDGKFVSIGDDGSVMTDSPAELPKKISVVAAARLLKLL
jgi:hypothetical protein